MEYATFHFLGVGEFGVLGLQGCVRAWEFRGSGLVAQILTASRDGSRSFP